LTGSPPVSLSARRSFARRGLTRGQALPSSKHQILHHSPDGAATSQTLNLRKSISSHA